MTLYKALVKNKQSKKLEIIASESRTKTDFILNLRGNGYSVNTDKVKTAETFDYIMNYTNCEWWDWKENK